MTVDERWLQFPPDQQIALLGAVFADSADGLAFFDANSLLRVANASFSRQLGLAQDGLLGQSGAAIPGWDEQLAPLLDQVRATGEPFQAHAYPLRLGRPSEAGPAYWDMQLTALNGASGDFIGWLVCLRDVSERQRVEESLQESESRYRALFHNMDSGFAYHRMILDEAGRPVDYVFLEINDAFERLTGLRREDIVGRRVTEVLPGIKDSEFDWIGTYGRVALTGEPANFDSYAEYLERWYLISAYSPRRGYFVAQFSDISEYKRIEKELRKANDKLQILVRLVENSPDLLSAVDRDYVYRVANPTYARMNQLPLEQIVGHTVAEILSPRVFEDLVRPKLDRAFAGESVSYASWFDYRAVGRRYMAVQYYPLWNEGRVEYVVATIRDLTEWKQAVDERERLLSEIERRATTLDAVFESTHAQLALLDLDLNFVLVNSAYAAGSGHSKDQLIGRPHFELFPNAENQAIFERVRDTGEPYYIVEKPFEFANQPTRGTSYWNWSLAPIKDAAGRVQSILLSLVDVSEVVRSRLQMVEYVSLISHDLRAPLTVIHGQSQIIRQMPDRRNLVTKSADAITLATRRMNTMIQDLVDSARLESGQVALEKQNLQLLEFLQDLLERSRFSLEVQRIKVEAAPDLPLVAADPDRLERILLNLLTNALKYSEPSTEVRVHMAAVDDQVEVAVSDQGAGIAADDLPRVFERFYRAGTSSRADGLGLGLYITRMLVEAHGGSINAESQVGQGSTFRFTLPAVV